MSLDSRERSGLETGVSECVCVCETVPRVTRMGAGEGMVTFVLWEKRSSQQQGGEQSVPSREKLQGETRNWM